MNRMGTSLPAADVGASVLALSLTTSGDRHLSWPPRADGHARHNGASLREAVSRQQMDLYDALVQNQLTDAQQRSVVSALSYRRST